MVADAYGTILNELAEILKIPKLVPDPNHSCLIRLKNGLEVQIEPDASDEALLIGANIANITPGAFRISVFKEALKANALPPPQTGIFAWSKKADQLVLFKIIPMKGLTGDKVADFLYPFAATAIKWQETLKAGQVPQVETANQRSISSGMFGLNR